MKPLLFTALDQYETLTSASSSSSSSPGPRRSHSTDECLSELVLQTGPGLSVLHGVSCPVLPGCAGGRRPAARRCRPEVGQTNPGWRRRCSSSPDLLHRSKEIQLTLRGTCWFKCLCRRFVREDVPLSDRVQFQKIQ